VHLAKNNIYSKSPTKMIGICRPAYAGARSRWLTLNPAKEIPDEPTAQMMRNTASDALLT